MVTPSGRTFHCLTPLAVIIWRSRLALSEAFIWLNPDHASSPDFHLRPANNRVLANTSPIGVGRFLVTAFKGRKSQIHRPISSSFLYTMWVRVLHSLFGSSVGTLRCQRASAFLICLPPLGASAVSTPAMRQTGVVSHSTVCSG